MARETEHCGQKHIRRAAVDHEQVGGHLLPELKLAIAAKTKQIFQRFLPWWRFAVKKILSVHLARGKYVAGFPCWGQTPSRISRAAARNQAVL